MARLFGHSRERNSTFSDSTTPNKEAYPKRPTRDSDSEERNKTVAKARRTRTDGVIGNISFRWNEENENSGQERKGGCQSG